MINRNSTDQEIAHALSNGQALMYGEIEILYDRFTALLDLVDAQEAFIQRIKDRVDGAHEKMEEARTYADSILLGVENQLGEICNDLEEHIE